MKASNKEKNNRSGSKDDTKRNNRERGKWKRDKKRVHGSNAKEMLYVSDWI